MNWIKITDETFPEMGADILGWCPDVPKPGLEIFRLSVGFDHWIEKSYRQDPKWNEKSEKDRYIEELEFVPFDEWNISHFVYCNEPED